jgi:transcriptional regulator with XRE-family HTH domain
VRVSEDTARVRSRAGAGVAMNAGGRVRRARRERGLSLEVLAGRIGRSKGWLSMIENGRLRLDRLSDITALADVLRVPVPVLIGVPCPGCPRTLGGGGSGR